MKHLILLVSLIATATSQRPTYAGSSPIGVPGVADRFTSTTSRPSAGADLADRVGVDSSSTTTDGRVIVDPVKMVETWPKENQPFWFINAQHLQNQKYPNGMRPNQTVTPSNQLPASNQNKPETPINNRNDLPETTPQKTSDGAENSFTVYKGNERKTYVYDPISDSWVLKKN